MKITIFLAAFGLFTPAVSFAQSNLVFFDQSGDRLGALVQFREQNSCDAGAGVNPLYSCNAIIRRDRYLFEVNLLTGELAQTKFWYLFNDCSGTPQLGLDDYGARGGLIVYTRSGETPILGRVDWNAPINTNFLRAYMQENGECADNGNSQDSIPITVVQPSDYGMKQLPQQVAPGQIGLGFLPPISPSVEKPDGSFCDGFESCPKP